MDKNENKIENASPPAENILENAVEVEGMELQPDMDNSTGSLKEHRKTVR